MLAASEPPVRGRKPPRFRGCISCRRRKKGCDMRRPFCLRCAEAGRACEGYGEQSRLTSSLGKSASIRQGCQGAISLGGGSQASLRIAAIRSGFSSTAWTILQPSTGPPIMYSWILDLPSIHVPGSAACLAYLAVSLCAIGQEMSDSRLLRASHHAYSASLHGLQNLISDEMTATSDETLGCTLILALYECICESPNPSIPKSFSHVAGACSLLKMRKPTAHCTPLGRAMLSDLRQNEFLQAIARRDPSFLASPSWLTIPWRDVPKTPCELLFEVLTEIPPFIQQTDEFTRALPLEDPSVGLERLRRSHAGILQSLETWRVYAVQAGAHISSVESYKKLTDNDWFYLTSLRFPDVAAAELEALCACVRLILNKELCSVCDALACSVASAGIAEQEKGSVDTGGPTLRSSLIFEKATLRRQMHVFAEIIVCSLRSMMESDAGLLGAIPFPFVMSCAFLKKHHSERFEDLLKLMTPSEQLPACVLISRRVVMECIGSGVLDVLA